MNTIKNSILENLRSAKTSIKVAVSWLTDLSLINELIKARKRGIEVKIVLSANELNINFFEEFEELIKLDAPVQKWGNPDALDGHFMHYKFYIIDDIRAYSGSYNWSLNAETNKEALDSVEVKKKLSQFELVYKESVDFFDEVENPYELRNNLRKIQKEIKRELTPERLTEYRARQSAIQQERVQQEEARRIEKQEADRKHQEEIQKMEREKAAEEKRHMEELDRIKRETKEAERYEKKEDTPTKVVPPTSYGL